MAARSRAIEARLERLLPAMEEYYVAGAITKDELTAIARARLTHEFKLIARPMLYLDVQAVIRFERDLEAKIEAFASKTKLQLKHRWAVADRIENVFRVSIPRLHDRDERNALEDQYVLFLRSLSRHAALSAFLASQLQRNPRSSKYYALAAEAECDQGNVDNARAICQKGIDLLPEQPSLWRSALRTELCFAHGLLKGIRGEATTSPGAKETKAREVNEALGQILFDLALARSIIAASWGSSAAGAVLLDALHAELLSFEFTKTLVFEHIAIAAHHAAQCVADAPTAAIERSWSVTFSAAMEKAWSAPASLLLKGVVTPSQFVDSVVIKVSAADAASVPILAAAALDVAAEHSRALLPAAVAAVERVAPRDADQSVSPAFQGYVAARLIRKSWSPTVADITGAPGPSQAAQDSVQSLQDLLSGADLAAALGDRRQTPIWNSTAAERRALEIASVANAQLQEKEPGNAAPIQDAGIVGRAVWSNFSPGRTTAGQVRTALAAVAAPIGRDRKPVLARILETWRWFALRAIADNATKADVAPGKRGAVAADEESDDDCDRRAPEAAAMLAIRAITNLAPQPDDAARRAEALAELCDIALRSALSSGGEDTAYVGQSASDLWAQAPASTHGAAMVTARAVVDLFTKGAAAVDVAVLGRPVAPFLAAGAARPEVSRAARTEAIDLCRRCHRAVTARGAGSANAAAWAAYIHFEQSVAKRHDLAQVVRRDAESALKNPGMLFAALTAIHDNTA